LIPPRDFTKITVHRTFTDKAPFIPLNKALILGCRPFSPSRFLRSGQNATLGGAASQALQPRSREPALGQAEQAAANLIAQEIEIIATAISRTRPVILGEFRCNRPIATAASDELRSIRSKGCVQILVFAVDRPSFHGSREAGPHRVSIPFNRKATALY
jgi:hypothetical protein